MRYTKNTKIRNSKVSTILHFLFTIHIISLLFKSNILYYTIARKYHNYYEVHTLKVMLMLNLC